MLALLVLLVLWAVLSGGDGNGTNDEGKGGHGGNGPASTITPGPTDSGPAISDRPGGRDNGGSEGSGGSDGDGGSGSGGSGGGSGDGGSAGGSGWAPGPGAGAGSDGEGGSGGGGGGGVGSGGGAAGVPADSSLPTCKKADTALSLHSVKDEYAPGDKPKFELTVENARGTACKIDLGRTATVVTISDSDDDKFWASDDCQGEGTPALRQIPAKGESVHTLTWFRKPSSADCATPASASAKPGKYEIEVAVKGLKTVHTSFRLTKG